MIFIFINLLFARFECDTDRSLALSWVFLVKVCNPTKDIT